MNAYAFRVMSFSNGKERERVVWVRKPGPYLQTTSDLSDALILSGINGEDEARNVAKMWAEELGCEVHPVEIGEVGGFL